MVAAGAAVAGCARDQSTLGPVTLELTGEPVPLTRLGSAPAPLTYYSGLTTGQRVVIRDAETWRTTWSAIWSRVSPVPDLPSIDFGREMVVVAALGQRSGGGYGILVNAAATDATGLTILIRTTSPGRSCITTQALTQPVDVARLPRSELPVRFFDESVVTACD